MLPAWSSLRLEVDVSEVLITLVSVIKQIYMQDTIYLQIIYKDELKYSKEGTERKLTSRLNAVIN